MNIQCASVVGVVAAVCFAAACASSDTSGPAVPVPSPPSVRAPSELLSPPGAVSAPVDGPLGPVDGSRLGGEPVAASPPVSLADDPSGLDLRRAVLETSFEAAFALVARYDEITSLLEGSMLVTDECRRRFLPAEPCACYEFFGDTARIATLRAETLEALTAYGDLLDPVDEDVTDAGVADAYAGVAMDLEASCFSASMVELELDGFEADRVVGGVSDPPRLPRPVGLPDLADDVSAASDSLLPARARVRVERTLEVSFQDLLGVFDACRASGDLCTCSQVLRGLAVAVMDFDALPPGFTGLPPGIRRPAEVAAYLSLLDARLAGVCSVP